MSHLPQDKWHDLYVQWWLKHQKQKNIQYQLLGLLGKVPLLNFVLDPFPTPYLLAYFDHFLDLKNENNFRSIWKPLVLILVLVSNRSKILEIFYNFLCSVSVHEILSDYYCVHKCISMSQTRWLISLKRNTYSVFLEDLEYKLKSWKIFIKIN